MFLKLLSPFAPHITEELWGDLGHVESITFESWPIVDESKLVESEVRITVQINGKVRGEFFAETDISEDETKAKILEMPEIKKWIGEKKIERVIYVKNRIINLVVA